LRQTQGERAVIPFSELMKGFPSREWGRQLWRGRPLA